MITLAVSIICFVFFVEHGTAQSIDEDPIITIYKNTGRTGERQPVFVTNCFRVNDTNRRKVQQALSIDPRGYCLHIFEFDCCQGRSRIIQSSQLEILANLTELRLNSTATIIPRSISHCHDNDYEDDFEFPGDEKDNNDDKDDQDSPNRNRRRRRRENCESHSDAPDVVDDPCQCENNIKNGSTNLLHFQDDHSAIYIPYNQDNDNGIRSFVSLSWAYIKQMYGDFGREGKLYLLFDKLNPLNKTSQRFLAFNWDNLCRDFITLHRPRGDEDNLETARKELDEVSRRMSELVEESGRGTGKSPVKNLMQDGAYTDIFLYDLYSHTGMDQDAQRIYDTARDKISNFPKKGTNWFKNWFFPIYNNTQYGGSTYLARFFNMTHTYFEKRPCRMGKGPIFVRSFTLGEFIHFSSGAARTLLNETAKEAFDVDLASDEDFLNATVNYPEILKLYTEPEPLTETSTESTTTTTTEESTTLKTRRPRRTTKITTTTNGQKSSTRRLRPLTTRIPTVPTPPTRPTYNPLRP